MKNKPYQILPYFLKSVHSLKLQMTLASLRALSDNHFLQSIGKSPSYNCYVLFLSTSKKQYINRKKRNQWTSESIQEGTKQIKKEPLYLFFTYIFFIRLFISHKANQKIISCSKKCSCFVKGTVEMLFKS